MVVTILLEKLLEVQVEDLPSQYFHATCSVQQVLGLLHFKEHPEKRFMTDALHLLGQLGLKCGCDYPPPLPKPM